MRMRVATTAAALVVLTTALAGCQSAGQSTTDTAGASGSGSVAPVVAEATSEVEAAMAPVTSGVPDSGPAATPGKFVVLIPCAQAGEGCALPAEGAKAAAEAMGWRAQIIDGAGTVQGQSDAINQAITLKPDGIITFAVDPSGVSGAISAARAAGIKVVSSSAAETDAVDFAGIPAEETWAKSGRLLADLAISQTGGKAKSIVLTGNEFAALDPRSDAYAERLGECDGCEVVATENFAFADMSSSLPQLVQQLVQSNAEVNSIYVVYDAAVPSVLQGLKSIGRDDIMVLSGDGTSDALQCLRTSCGQTASAALPLTWLGWADIDIMNRVFAGQDPAEGATGLPVRLFTTENVPSEAGTWNGDLDFETAYKTLWGVS